MSDKKLKKEYSNGEVTITWEPHKCIHSGKCASGLPNVFDPKRKPWIDPMASTTEKIVEQVQECPSGALGYYFENDSSKENVEVGKEQIVEVMKNGPLMVYGNMTVKMSDGTTKKQHKVSAFCRCGGSQNKPFCDGTHKKIDFKG